MSERPGTTTQFGKVIARRAGGPHADQGSNIENVAPTDEEVSTVRDATMCLPPPPRPWQKLHHFMGMYVIGRKDRLARTCAAARRQFGAAFVPFIPETFVVPFETASFIARYEQALQQTRALRQLAPTILQRESGGSPAGQRFTSQDFEAISNVDPIMALGYAPKASDGAAAGVFNVLSTERIDFSREFDHNQYVEIIRNQLLEAAPTQEAAQLLLRSCALTEDAELSMCPLNIPRSIAFLGQSTPLWISKPAASSRGRGIRIMSKMSEIQQFLGQEYSRTSKDTDPLPEPEISPTALAQQPRNRFKSVVSRYISNPLLIAGRKFDLRIYVLVTCADPLVFYVYSEGIVRFCTEQYDIPRTEAQRKCRYANLTNFSVNKSNVNVFTAHDEDELIDQAASSERRSSTQQECKNGCAAETTAIVEDGNQNDDTDDEDDATDMDDDVSLEEETGENDEDMPDELLNGNPETETRLEGKTNDSSATQFDRSHSQEATCAKKLDWDKLCKSSKWPLSLFRRYLSEVLSVDTEAVFAAIEDLICRTIIIGAPNLISVDKMRGVHRFQTAELLGFDVLLDAGLNPWLMEVNVGPSLGVSTKLDLRTKFPLLRDTFNLAGVEPIDGKKALLGEVTSFYSVATRGSKNPSSVSTQSIFDIGKGLGTKIPKNIPKSILVPPDCPVFRLPELADETSAQGKKGQYKGNNKSILRTFAPAPSAMMSERQAAVRACLRGSPLEFLDHLFRPPDIAMLRRLDAEQLRTGGFKRLFPTPKTVERYAPYLPPASRGLAVVIRFMELPEPLARWLLGPRSEAYPKLEHSPLHDPKLVSPYVQKLMEYLQEKPSQSSGLKVDSTELSSNTLDRDLLDPKLKSLNRKPIPLKSESSRMKSLVAAINSAEKLGQTLEELPRSRCAPDTHQTVSKDGRPSQGSSSATIAMSKPPLFQTGHGLTERAGMGLISHPLTSQIGPSVAPIPRSVYPIGYSHVRPASRSNESASPLSLAACLSVTSASSTQAMAIDLSALTAGSRGSGYHPIPTMYYANGSAMARPTRASSYLSGSFGGPSHHTRATRL